MKLKTCTNCGEEKQLSCFSKHKNGKDGYNSQCKVCRALKTKEWKDKNKAKLKESRRLYYILNKEKEKAQNIQWRANNKNHLRIYDNTYKNNKRKNNTGFKIISTFRTRIRKALKENWKSGKTIELLGCTLQELKTYLESKFKPGMSLDNHGRGWNGKKEWHIDHIRPCASFDLSKLEEQKKCFHYTNLQPLWAEENLKKADNYE